MRFVLIICIVACLVSPSHAVIGQLVRKAVTATGKRSTSVIRQSSKEATRRTVTSGLSTAGKTAVRHGAHANLKPFVTTGTRSAVKASSMASIRVMDGLGIEGARALKRLSPAAREKLANMSGALAQSPHRAAWLQTIAKHGDGAMNWLWKHKGSVAVGTVATAILVKPDKFMETVGSIAETAVEATTKHVIAPVVRPASMQVATSIITAIAASVGVVTLWATGGLTSLLTLLGLSKWAVRKTQSK